MIIPAGKTLRGKLPPIGLLFIFVLCLLVIPNTLALKECKGIMTKADLPCMVISSWTYPNACNTYLVTIYNSTPSVVNTRFMTDYADTGLCNTTFGTFDNETNVNTYIFNITNADSGRIKVEAGGDQMIVAVIVIGLILLFLGFMFKVTTKAPLRTLYIGLLFFFLLIAVNFSKLYLIESNASSSIVSMLNMAYLVLLWVTILTMAIMVIEVIIWTIKSLAEQRDQNDFKPW